MADNKNIFPMPDQDNQQGNDADDAVETVDTVDGEGDVEAPETNYDPEPVVIEEEEFDDDFNIVLDDGTSDTIGDGEVSKEWYVVHTYSGYENKVKHGIMQRIETMGMKDRIFDVLIPEEEEIEIKDGKRKPVKKRVFPGYILVQMRMDEDSWYVVRNTPGVTGFVGMGNEPQALMPEEVKRILNRMEAETPKVNVDFKLGEKVRIVGGPFNDMIGKVSDIDTGRQKVRVMVDFFGRETPVELDFLEVESTT